MRGVAVAELKRLYRLRTVSDTTKGLAARHKVLVDTYTDFRRSLPFRAPVPTVGDIANAPSVRALLAQPPQQPTPADNSTGASQDPALSPDAPGSADAASERTPLLAGLRGQLGLGRTAGTGPRRGRPATPESGDGDGRGGEDFEHVA